MENYGQQIIVHYLQKSKISKKELQNYRAYFGKVVVVGCGVAGVHYRIRQVCPVEFYENTLIKIFGNSLSLSVLTCRGTFTRTRVNTVCRLPVRASISATETCEGLFNAVALHIVLAYPLVPRD